MKSEKTQDGNSVDVKVSRKNVNEYVKEIDGDQMQKDTAEGLEASLKDLDEKVENNNDESVKEFKKAAAKLQTMSSHSALSTLDSLSGQIYASSQALTFEQSQTWVGVGALTEFNPRMAWYVNYDAKLRSDKNNNNVFTTGLRWSF